MVWSMHEMFEEKKEANVLERMNKVNNRRIVSEDETHILKESKL